MKRRTLLALMIAASLAGGVASAADVLRMSTTTSTDNSGLLGWLLPAFEAKTGIKVNVISVGTGKALELAKNGDVDVTLCTRGRWKTSSSPTAMASTAAT